MYLFPSQVESHKLSNILQAHFKLIAQRILLIQMYSTYNAIFGNNPESPYSCISNPYMNSSTEVTTFLLKTPYMPKSPYIDTRTQFQLLICIYCSLLCKSYGKGKVFRYFFQKHLNDSKT